MFVSHRFLFEADTYVNFHLLIELVRHNQMMRHHEPRWLHRMIRSEVAIPVCFNTHTHNHATHTNDNTHTPPKKQKQNHQCIFSPEHAEATHTHIHTYIREYIYIYIRTRLRYHSNTQRAPLSAFASLLNPNPNRRKP